MCTKEFTFRKSEEKEYNHDCANQDYVPKEDTISDRLLSYFFLQMWAKWLHLWHKHFTKEKYWKTICCAIISKVIKVLSTFQEEQENSWDVIDIIEWEETYFDDSDWYKGFYEKEYNKVLFEKCTHQW